MDAIADAERRCAITTAKLSVAEELRFAVAVPSAFLVYVKFDTWLGALAAGIALFLLVPHWYAKEYDAAWDAYERVTGTGKYYKPSEPSDAA